MPEGDAPDQKPPPSLPLCRERIRLIKLRSTRKRRGQRVDPLPPLAPTIKPCLDCREPFEAKTSKKRCCSCHLTRLRSIGRVYTASYLAKHKDRVRLGLERHREKQRAWRAANKHRMREVGRLWRRNNKEKVKAILQRHRAQKRATATERVYVQRIAEMQCGVCYLCGKDMGKDVSLDHLVPLAGGGTHTEGNCAAAHRNCNARKHKRSLLMALLRYREFSGAA